MVSPSKTAAPACKPIIYGRHQTAFETPPAVVGALAAASDPPFLKCNRPPVGPFVQRRESRERVVAWRQSPDCASLIRATSTARSVVGVPRSPDGVQRNPGLWAVSPA